MCEDKDKALYMIFLKTPPISSCIKRANLITDSIMSHDTKYVKCKNA